MHEQLKRKQCSVAGLRQVMKGIGADEVARVFLALDAAPQLQEQVRLAANERQIPVETVSSMEELGQLCRIEVPCAVAAVKREKNH